MNDNEIIKALEEYLQKCQNIKYGARQKILVDADFLEDVLDLINRQNAENERLNKAGEEAGSCFTRMESLYKIKCKELEVAKSEAIKEFADRLRKQATVDDDSTWWIANIDVDNLVEEMVGE